MDSKIFYKVSYGLYVVGSTKAGKTNGQIANTFFQISSDPATVAIGINKKNLTHEFIADSKVFSVSILPKSVGLDFIGHFGFHSGRDTDKYEAIPFKAGSTGAPIVLENTVGYIEAEVIDSLDVETHTVFIGRVVNSEVLSNEEPMTYAYYQQVKRGGAPAAAASQHISDNPRAEKQTETTKEDSKMKKYECSVCGYVYDPAVGDPDSGIAAGTAFEDIPNDWVCPTCGASKDQFAPVA